MSDHTGSSVCISPPSTPDDAYWLEEFWRSEWGGSVMISNGKTHHLDKLHALIAWDEKVRVGVATYAVQGDSCEVLSLNALQEGRGIGTALMEAIEEKARAAGVSRVWLITTNDNLEALRFYQLRGYRIVDIHVGAVDRARAVKQSIPVIGYHGIPLHDELELEKYVR